MERNISQMILAGVIILLLVLGILQFLLPINHDVAANIYRSGRLLDGARLYIDILDTHPPFIFWFGVPPMWLSRVMQWPEKWVFYVYLFMVIGLSLWLCNGILKKILDLKDVLARKVVFFTLTILVAFFNAKAFGQREQIIITLLLPYIFSVTAYASGIGLSWHLRLVNGVMALMAFMIKPYYLLIWIGIEAYLLVHIGFRSWIKRCENWTIISGGLLYCILVYIFAPEFYTWVFITMKIYTALNTPLLAVLFSKGNVIWLVAIAAFFLDKFIGSQAQFRKIMILVITLLYVVVIVQMKGWGYHFLPAYIVAIFFSLVVGIRFLISGKMLKNNNHLLILGIFVLILVGAFSHSFYRVAVYENSRETIDEFIELVKDNAKGKPIFYFSRLPLQPIWPSIIEGQGQWHVRFVHLFQIEAFYPNNRNMYHPVNHMDPVEKYFFNAVIEDLLAEPPELLIQDAPVSEDLFNALEYFSMDERFSRFLSDYYYLRTVTNSNPDAMIKTFIVYKKKPVETNSGMHSPMNP